MATNDTCPVCRTADVVCGKWTLLLVKGLADGHSRFCELERALQGISPRTLSLRLRALEEEGIIARHTFPEVPPRVEYLLTDKGRALVPLIEDMRTYGLQWLGGDLVDGGGGPFSEDGCELDGSDLRNADIKAGTQPAVVLA